MISGVARAKVPVVFGFVVWFAWGQRTQPARGQQALADDVQNRVPVFLGEDRIIERDREDLIGAAGSIVASLAVHHVEQVFLARIPEAAVEGFAGALRSLAELVDFRAAFFAHPALGQPEGVIPERIDLDRLAASG